ncbi:hypothetical protein PRIPAC_94467 [Pristionchus pacificus]|uniref:G protein-coupled receptor n=1 Tax=Pristionchus pacificus TaxID=54126 RepID=A0A2A6BPY0_PRIPA|nr:hypothetical protein PRIPAC_94467 [Pristionchus pacificus]|eukprot:PDM67833.1 G protein-coupled receptor [Pristionchus pacificus]
MPTYQSFVGATTLALSTLAIYLIATKIHHSAKPFVKYLIILQVSLAIDDLNFRLLARPIFLYPLPGALSNGVLRPVLGLNGHCLMFISVVAVAVAVNYCIHYKHATVEQMCGGKSFTTSHRGAYRLFVLLIWSAPCLLYIGQHRELEGALLFVKICSFSLRTLQLQQQAMRQLIIQSK